MVKGLMCGAEMVGGKGAVAILILRFVAGLAFIQHGWPKIQHAFNWMGPEATVPGFLQALAALSEFGAGIALILGLLTRLAALGIACTMLFAILMVHVAKGDPFVSRGGSSYELAAVYLAIMVVLLLRGAGQISLDALMCRKKQ